MTIFELETSEVGLLDGLYSRKIGEEVRLASITGLLSTGSGFTSSEGCSACRHRLEFLKDLALSILSLNFAFLTANSFRRQMRESRFCLHC